MSITAKDLFSYVDECVPLDPKSRVNETLTEGLRAVKQTDHDVRMSRLHSILGSWKSGFTFKNSQDRSKMCEKLISIVKNDKYPTVLGLAFKCLTEILSRLDESDVAILKKKLGEMGLMLMDRGPESLFKRLMDEESARDKVASAIKATIEKLENHSPEMKKGVVEATIRYILQGCKDKDDKELRSQSADILVTLLKFCAEHVELKYQDEILKMLWDLTMSSHQAAAFGYVAEFLESDVLVQKVYRPICEKLKKTTQDGRLGSQYRSIQILDAIVSNGNGYSTCVKDTVDTLLNILNADFLTENDEFDDDDEFQAKQIDVRTSAWKILGTLIRKCPKETAADEEKIIAKCIEHVGFNPNVAASGLDDSTSGGSTKMNVDEDEDPYMGYGGGGDAYGGYGGGDDAYGGYGGGDDAYGGDNFADDSFNDGSYKVRQAAIETIQSIVIARPASLKMLYRRCCEKLIEAFNDSDEEVTKSALSCFSDMLEASLVIDETSEVSRLGDFPAPPMLRKVQSATDQLDEMIREQTIIKTAGKRLKDCTYETKKAILLMLRVYFIVLKTKNMMHLVKEEHLVDLAVETAGTDGKNLNLDGEADLTDFKIEICKLLRNLCATLDKQATLPTLQKIVEKTFDFVVGRMKKGEDNGVKEHALLTLEHFLKNSEVDCSKFVGKKISKCVGRLVKNGVTGPRTAALSLVGPLVAAHGDKIDGKWKSDIFESMLKIEKEDYISTVLKSFRCVAESKNSSAIDSSLLARLEDKIFTSLANFDQQTDLQLARMKTLKILIERYPDSMRETKTVKNIAKLEGFVSEKSTPVALEVLSVACIVQEKFDRAMTRELMNSALSLLNSEVVSCNETSELFVKLETFVRNQVRGDNALIENLIDVCSKMKSTEYSRLNIASIVGSCLIDTNDVNFIDGILRSFVDDKTLKQKLGLHIIGAVGSRADISKSKTKYFELLRRVAANHPPLEATAAAVYGMVVFGGLGANLVTMLRDPSMKGDFKMIALRSVFQLANRQSGIVLSEELAGEAMSCVAGEFGAPTESSISVECAGLILSSKKSKAWDNLFKMCFAAESSNAKRQAACKSVLLACKIDSSAFDKLDDARVKELISWEATDFEKAEKAGKSLEELIEIAGVHQASIEFLTKAIRERPRLVQKFITEDRFIALQEAVKFSKGLISEIQMGQIKKKHDHGKELRIAASHCFVAILRNDALRATVFRTNEICEAFYSEQDRNIRKSQDMGETEVIMAALESLIAFAPHSPLKWIFDQKGDAKRKKSAAKSIFNRIKMVFNKYHNMGEVGRMCDILGRYLEASELARSTSPQAYRETRKMLEEAASKVDGGASKVAE